MGLDQNVDYPFFSNLAASLLGFLLLLPIIFILLTLDFILIPSLNTTTYIIIHYYFIILSQLIADYHFISDHHQSDSHYSAVFLN